MTVRGPLRVFISAGEPSGDLHAAGFIEELKGRAEVTVEAIGGGRMEAAGAGIVFPMERLCVVGLSEAVVKLPALAGAYLRTRSLWRRSRPDLFVPVDFPGFNMRLARLARSLGIPSVYYIPPQVWAWGAGRVDELKKVIDGVAVVLPFEEEIYRRAGIPVRYVGHPLAGSVRPAMAGRAFRAAYGLGEGSPLVGLLPGSRGHEVARLLPRMLMAFKRLKKKHPECRAAIGLADTVSEDSVRRSAREIGLNPPMFKGATHELIESSDVVVAASGTVTLEAAILLKPMIVVYAMSRLTYAVARRVVRTKHIALVNLVAGRRIVPELVQNEAEPAALCEELEGLLFDSERRRSVIAELKRVRDKLGESGAAGRAAEFALEITRGEVG